MPDHDRDTEILGRTRIGAPEHATGLETMPAHAPQLSSRAVADGRTGPLDTPAVRHLQAFAGNASVSRLFEDDQAPEKVRSVVDGGGERMDTDMAWSMSQRFGEDFSDVRIHHGGAASESARAVHAQAYTVGNDVVFDAGKYDPASPTGQRTLAHELTHVIQQRNGSVSGTDIGGGMAVSHPADRFEQDASRTAERIVGSAGTSLPPAVSAQRSVDDRPSVDLIAQRGIAIETATGDEDDEMVGAGLVAQREGDDELEEDELPA